MGFFKSLFASDDTIKLERDQKYEHEISRLRAVNDEKRRQAIAQLGEKWLLHPNNKVKNLEIKENTLGLKTA
jgi:hypothetical protein